MVFTLTTSVAVIFAAGFIPLAFLYKRCVSGIDASLSYSTSSFLFWSETANHAVVKPEALVQFFLKKENDETKPKV